MNNSILTVVIPAYNAEKYISETIDSVLNQKTNFNFDIFISDDCSIDETYNICLNYSLKHANLKVFKQPQNLGMTKNQHFVVTYPKTKYISYLDSDDLFYDEYYLQKQVDILESNLDVEVIFCNVLNFNELENVDKIKFDEKKIPPIKFDLHDYLKNTYSITNSATIFRQKSTSTIPSFFVNYFQYDWLLHIHHGLIGKFYYNNFVGVKYRIHSSNATSKNYDKILKSAIDLVYYINSYLPIEYHKYFKHPLFELNRLAFFYLKRRNYSNFFHYYIKWLKVVEMKNFKFRDQLWLFKNAIFNYSGGDK
jgi:glycosyltransferase involved in cell wall biosynthesis